MFFYGLKTFNLYLYIILAGYIIDDAIKCPRTHPEKLNATVYQKQLTAYPAAPQPLAEPLTNRELDFLELLTQRLSNKEIAEKLFISPTTVKRHLKNIYQQPEANKRREVVEKAKNLGIL